VFAIGDCVAPRLLADCVFDGHRLAREIDSAIRSARCRCGGSVASSPAHAGSVPACGEPDQAARPRLPGLIDGSFAGRLQSRLVCCYWSGASAWRR